MKLSIVLVAAILSTGTSKRTISKHAMQTISTDSHRSSTIASFKQIHTVASFEQLAYGLSEGELQKAKEELHDATVAILERILEPGDSGSESSWRLPSLSKITLGYWGASDDGGANKSTPLILPGWMNKAMFVSVGDCIVKSLSGEASSNEKLKKQVHLITQQDYTWRVLDDTERAALVKDTDGHLTSTLKSWKSTVARASSYENLKNGIWTEKRERLKEMDNNITELETTLKVENWYSETREKCMEEEKTKQAEYLKMWTEQLQGKCIGSESSMKLKFTSIVPGSTCAAIPEGQNTKGLFCPEGSECGVASQRFSAGKTGALGLALYGVIAGSISLLASPSVLMVMPGPVEFMALTGFLSSHSHTCMCLPVACAWSNSHSVCAADKVGAKTGPLSATIPLAGFKCVEQSAGSQSCRLDPCMQTDYEYLSDEFSKMKEQMLDDSDDMSGADFVGKVGVSGRNSFNCWSLNGAKSDQLDVNTRRKVYHKLDEMSGWL